MVEPTAECDAVHWYYLNQIAPSFLTVSGITRANEDPSMNILPFVLSLLTATLYPLQNASAEPLCQPQDVAAFAVLQADAPAGSFKEWLSANKTWAKMYPDRARFFSDNPNAAEKYRNEWNDWRERRQSFSEWASQHPDWVATHPDRAMFFRSHPDLADKHQNEWLFSREGRYAFQAWEQAHKQ